MLHLRSWYSIGKYATKEMPYEKKKYSSLFLANCDVRIYPQLTRYSK